jgi:outer membrane protein OmpA-like peptidoglycan-associated protein
MMPISRIPKHFPETMKILSTLCLLLGVIATGPGIACAQKTEALDAGKLDHLKNAPKVETPALDVPKSLGATVAPPPKTIHYDEAKSVKIVPRANGTVEEQPFVPIPILFKVNTDKLLDATSADNVRLLAEKLAEIRRSDPSASFVIEGHASAEGDEEKNRDLSSRRARRIQALLGELSETPESHLSALGLGEDFARHEADAPDHLLQEDRRVLVVRTK